MDWFPHDVNFQEKFGTDLNSRRLFERQVGGKASCDRFRAMYVFSHGFSCFREYFLYSKVYRDLNIFGMNKLKSKRKLVNWLQKLNYKDTEPLFH